MSDSLAQVPSWQLGSDGFMYNDSKNNNNRLIIIKIIIINNNNKKKKTKIFTIRQDLHVFMYIIYIYDVCMHMGSYGFVHQLETPEIHI